MASCGDKPCGPAKNKDARTIIVNETLKQEPYSYILHQAFDRIIGGVYSSTSAFIAPNILITAHHNVMHKANIKGITFYNLSVDEDKGIYFKKKEVEIIPYKSSVNTSTDMAIIIFKKPEKIAPIYKGHFNIETIAKITDSSTVVHLTGFPCDVPDKLLDKKVYFHDSLPLLVYDMYTCTGDSGAPLWAVINGKPTIIGIHHGGSEGLFDDCTNASAKVDVNFTQWLKQYLK